MIIYRDIISDDEIISDSYPLKEVDGVVYECDCPMIEVDREKLDIGGNPSAEEEDEEDGREKVNKVIRDFRLQPTAFDKKVYMAVLQSYIKKVKTKLTEMQKDPEYIKDFETKAGAYVKKVILPFFKDWEFYSGESSDPDAMIILLNYRDDGITPYVVIWKHGLKEAKA